jgi:hypothetical protein
MTTAGLGEFIRLNHDRVVDRCVSRGALMNNRPSTEADATRTIPLFLDQLLTELIDASQAHASRTNTVEYGEQLFRRGLTVAQVVHDYGNVCQSVIDVATDMAIPISAGDYLALDRCLDDTIAGTVSAYRRNPERPPSSQSQELLTMINEAIVAFDELLGGAVGAIGTPAGVVYRSLHRIRLRLVDQK